MNSQTNRNTEEIENATMRKLVDTLMRLGYCEGFIHGIDNEANESDLNLVCRFDGVAELICIDLSDNGETVSVRLYGIKEAGRCGYTLARGAGHDVERLAIARMMLWLGNANHGSLALSEHIEIFRGSVFEKCMS